MFCHVATTVYVTAVTAWTEMWNVHSAPAWQACVSAAPISTCSYREPSSAEHHDGSAAHSGLVESGRSTVADTKRSGSPVRGVTVMSTACPRGTTALK